MPTPASIRFNITPTPDVKRSAEEVNEISFIYLDVNLALLSTAANQRRDFMEIWSRNTPLSLATTESSTRMTSKSVLRYA